MAHRRTQSIAKRHYLMADALFANFCEALREFPTLAQRLGLNLEPQPLESNLLAQIQDLPPDQQAKLLQEWMALFLGSNR